MNPILARIDKQLTDIRSDQRLRSLPRISHDRSRYIQVDGVTLLNLASNDYLGFSISPVLSRAATEALQVYGSSSGASRLVTGNGPLYTRLEEELAEYKGTEAALVFNSGYTANLCLLSSLADRHTLVFSDRLNHASIIDGIALSGARQIRYRHNDMEHLEQLLDKHREHPHKLIVSDSVFSMDGDLADLSGLVRLKKAHRALLMIDEAHATGIFGQGRGLAHELGVEQDIDLQMGTFSKALGSFGGYVAASRQLIDYLVNCGRSLIYTTGLPPATLAASLAAVRLVLGNPNIGRELNSRAEKLRQILSTRGIDSLKSASPIIPVVIGDNEKTMLVQQRLKEKGIYVGAIRPPTVPQGTARLRIALRADMDEDDDQQLEQALLEALCS